MAELILPPRIQYLADTVRNNAAPPPGARRQRKPREVEQFRIVAATPLRETARWLVVEQEPRVRVTKWHLGGQHTNRALSIPRSLFVLRLYRGVGEQCYLFFVRHAYCGGATILFNTIFPNQYQNGQICLGSTRALDTLMHLTRILRSDHDKAEAMLHWFWNKAHFNDHFIQRLQRGAALHPALLSLATWERASRHNPNFVNDVPWQVWGTVKDFFTSQGHLR